MTFSLPIAAEANALLDRDPLAVVVGMVLDQQILRPRRIGTYVKPAGDFARRAD